MPRRKQSDLEVLQQSQKKVQAARTALRAAEEEPNQQVASYSAEHPELSYTELSKLLDGGLSKTGVRYAILRVAPRRP